MRFLTALFLICSLSNCNSKSASEQEKEDSTKNLMLKDYTNNRMKEMHFDTIKVADGPVQIISSKLDRDKIVIDYKNNSKETITGAKFKWYLENTSSRPLDIISFEKGFGNGTDTKTVLPGERTTSKWDADTTNGKRIFLSWPYEISFENGTKWLSLKKL